MRYFSVITLALTAFSLACANAQEKKDQKATAEVPVVMSVTTVAVAEGTGCWAKIYDGHDFKGRSLTLVGAQALPHLEFPAGNDWEGDIDSLEVGPKAKLEIFEDENFADKKKELNSSQKVANLHKSEMSEGVESMRIKCI